MTTLTITLPLPPEELHPNSSPYFMLKRKKAKKARRDAGYATLHAMNEAREPGGWKRASVKCVFHFKAKRTRDHDNLMAWMKHPFDGLADAKLIVNDAGLTHEPPEIVEGSEDPRVELHVTRTDES